jgi:hypothetical protein
LDTREDRDRPTAPASEWIDTSGNKFQRKRNVSSDERTVSRHLRQPMTGRMSPTDRIAMTVAQARIRLRAKSRPSVLTENASDALRVGLVASI